MLLTHAIGLLLTATLLDSGASGVLTGAEWLRDPIFAGSETINLLHKEKGESPKLHGPQNVHTLFRKEIHLRDTPESAILTITGDDYYKFYIDGEFVVQGPESGYPFAHPYYRLDVSQFLGAGEHCLAAHGYYQGLLNRVWNSADNRAGFMLALDVTYAGGSTERFVTDASWHCFSLDAFASDRTIGYKTQFAEDIDMRRMPRGWNVTGFDDSAWLQPLAGRQDHQFVEQITHPLQHVTARPELARKKGDGNYFYDFGREIAGHTRIRIQGPRRHRITVRHGEELSGPDTVRHEMRANCNYEEIVTLSGQDDLIEFYDYKAFRYIEILDAPAEPEVWVDVRRHPFDPSRAVLSANGHPLEQIWNLCRNGVEMGAQGGFLDCPSREKGQYLGDAVITGRSHLWLTADPSLTRKCLLDFFHSQRACPGIMAVAPGSFMQEIAEYSLQWPLLLKEYYRHTGDRDFLRYMADFAFDPLFNYFARFEDGSGLLTGMTEKWVLVDWPDSLRDGYDYDYAKDKANTVLNAFYYGALETAAELVRALGRDAAVYEAKAARIEDAFAARLVDPNSGLYVDAPGSTHSSLHANAIPLYFGLTKGANKDAILGLIRERRLSCGVYIAAYVIEACFRNGEAELGYDLLTSSDAHSWNEMLKHGATACMEAWGPDQKKNTSWCHPWSSSPIYLVTEHVLGLGPAEPGWARIRFAPAKIAALPPMTLTVPTPRGQLEISYNPGAGYTLKAPAEVPVDTTAPEGVNVMVEQKATQAELGKDDFDTLEKLGWGGRAGASRAVWVSVARQRLYVIENGRAIWTAPCSTAEAGVGSEKDSFKTPVGWHRIAKKVGDGAPWGQQFKSQTPTGLIWRPGMDTKEDMVLTRILVLDGLEPGKNKGKNADGVSVDSLERSIYIHGTNGEDKIGTPASHGCIRLLNDNAITAYEMLPAETLVLITE